MPRYSSGNIQRAQRVMTMVKTTVGRIILVVFCAGFLLDCSKPKTDADLVKEAVTEVARAAEAKDVRDVMKYISKDYRGDDGSDYNAVKGIVFAQLFREDAVSIFIRGLDVDVTGDKAAAHLRVVMTRGKAVASLKDVPREAADAIKFEIVFKREDGAWKAVNAGWESIGLAGLL